MSSLLTFVNQATDMFGGAIDIIIIKQPDGTLRSTPFHVRFGRFKVLRSADKNIRLMINGKLTDMVMRINPADGVGYFVNTEDEPYGLDEAFGEEDYEPYEPSEGLQDEAIDDSFDEDVEDAEISDESNTETLNDIESSDFDRYGQDSQLNDSTSEIDRMNELILRKSAEEMEKEVLKIHTSVTPTIIPTSDSDTSLPLLENTVNTVDTISSISRDQMSKSNGALSEKTSEPLKEYQGMNAQFTSQANTILDDSTSKKPEQDVKNISDANSNQTELTINTSITQKRTLFGLLGRSQTTPPTPTESRKSTWGLLKRFFGVGDEKEEILEKDEYVEQSLRETFHKKYNVDLDKAGSANKDSIPIFPKDNFGTQKPQQITPSKPIMKRNPSTSIPITRKPYSFITDDESDEDSTLTPSLPQDIRNSIIELNSRPISASVPRNFGVSKEFPEGINKSVRFTEDIEKDLSEPKKEPEQKSWNWLFSSRPQQEKGPPKLRVKFRSKPLQRQLQSLNLKRGKNTIKYVVTGRVLGKQEVEANLYLWNYDDRIVISDVDGTITKSDGLGHVLPFFGMDWSHGGIAELYTSIVKNGYKIIYLTARSIVQSSATRSYLNSLRQGRLSLPEGPIIMSSDRLFACLTREVILRRPEEFKIATLQEIKSLFDSNDNPQPFFAGFGNRITDTISYRTVGIPDQKIFMIDPSGNIKVYDTLQHKSYTDIHQLVNLMFPDVKSKFVSTDLAYWDLGIPSVKSLENLRKLEKESEEEEEPVQS